jgi:hypothetical protein
MSTDDEEAVEMTEVEVKLYKAGLYQKFLTLELFDESNELVDEVMAEFKEFALEKMQTLMGMGSVPTSVSGFTPREITLLKLMLSEAMDDAVPEPPKPQKKEVEVEKKPLKAPVRKFVLGSKPKDNKTKDPEYTTCPEDKEERTIRGQKIRFTVRDYTPGEYGEAIDQRIQSIEIDESIRFEDGLWVRRNNSGGLEKIIGLNVTQQAGVQQAMPFPSIEQMQSITQMQAIQQADLRTSTNQVLGLINGRR